MSLKSFFRSFFALMLAFSLLSGAAVMAQQEPSVDQVYAAASAGKLDEAQVMIQQVLITHPNSAKAFFVQSELYAKQGKFAQARDSLANAERLSAGRPFAKPEAVLALKNEISSRLAAGNQNVVHATPAQSSAGSGSSSGGWVTPLLLAVVVIGLAYFIFRRRAPVVDYTAQQPGYNTLNGPQGFGNAQQPGYPAYPPQGPQPGYYPPAQGPGLGSRIAGGVATGLAVGAGVVAAEAIGRELMGGHHDNGAPRYDTTGNNFQPIDQNSDMGGNNFGVTDAGSWDSGGGSSDGGGSWDN